MAYEPTNWKAGDVVTSAKLNKMENGIANAVLTVHQVQDGETIRLDKTWQEMFDAISNDHVVMLNGVDESEEIPGAYSRPFISLYYDTESQKYRALDSNDHMYIADSADDYPVLVD